MSVGCEAHPKRAANSTIIGQNNCPFIFGAIAVMGGLLLPLSVHLLDVLLIFSVSLTIAVLIATFSAQRPLEVSGFPLLILVSAMLHAVVNVASSKLILSQGICGTIVGFISSVIVRNNGTVWILVAVTLVAVVFTAIYKVVRDIGRIVSEVLAEIVPARQESICNYLSAGVISERQVLDLREKTVRESRLLIAMNGAVRFVLCAAIIELATIIVTIVGGFAFGAADGTFAEISVKTCTGSALSAGLLAEVCALITVAASRYLVQRCSVSPLAWEDLAEQERAKRVEIIDRSPECKTAGSGLVHKPSWHITTKSQIDNSLNCAPQAEYFDAQFAEITELTAAGSTEADEIATTEDIDASDESCHPQAGTNAAISRSGESISWQTCSGEHYYDAAARFIADQSGGSAKTILMAATSVEWLPVTVPVNISIRLAQMGRKCLLVDLDFERGVISKVFDIDAGDHQTENIASAAPSDEAEKETVATRISNIYILPATSFGRYDVISIRQMIANLKSGFDHLIIYAPKVSTDTENAAGCAEIAMLFGPEEESDNPSMSSLHKFLVGCGCEVYKEPPAALAEAARLQQSVAINQ